MAFVIEDDFLKPDSGLDFPVPIPRTHEVKNVGSSVFREILIESKIKTNKTKDELISIGAALISGA